MDTASVRLTIPQTLFEQYLAQANGLTPEEVMAERLKSCVTHNAKKGLYLNDEERKRIELLLRRNYATPEFMIQDLEGLATIGVYNVSMNLSPDLLRRLRSRCIGQETFKQFLKRVIIEELERYCEMR